MVVLHVFLFGSGLLGCFVSPCGSSAWFCNCFVSLYNRIASIWGHSRGLCDCSASLCDHFARGHLRFVSLRGFFESSLPFRWHFLSPFSFHLRLRCYFFASLVVLCVFVYVVHLLVCVLCLIAVVLRPFFVFLLFVIVLHLSVVLFCACSLAICIYLLSLCISRFVSVRFGCPSGCFASVASTWGGYFCLSLVVLPQFVDVVSLTFCS